MKLADFNYDLPESLIAQFPAKPRDSSKLMVVSDLVSHKEFTDVVDYFLPGDVLVVNETKVMSSKIIGAKETGTPVELVIETFNGKKASCWMKAKNPKVGNKLIFGKYIGIVVKQEKAQVDVEFNVDVSKILKDKGILPLPPYIKKKLENEDQYQTIYSKKKGSVAAPTAGLHFTKRVLEKLKKKGVKIAKVVLHVDFGTFLPVRDINVEKLHKEYYEVDSKNAKLINSAKRLFVVGTTSMRTLESVASKGKVKASSGTTEIFIKPGYKFKLNYAGMITNFHLPKSTLLMLVSAFIGRKRILDVYELAVSKKYRFFSFGDAMLLLK